MSRKRKNGSAAVSAPPKPSEVLLVTGFPAFTARRIALGALEQDGSAHVFLLVRAKFRAAAEALVAALSPEQRERIELVEGDVCNMDLGLSGEDHRRIAERITTIHHLAAVYYLGTHEREAERVNVEGTREVLGFARECAHLRALVHYSTVGVAGGRKGVVLEDDLDCGQSFRNHYEETKFRAEKLVREAMRHLPCVVLRLGTVVGDSRTGEIDKFDGPYSLIVLIAESRVDLPLPLPGRGNAPLYLAPIDWVVAAALQIAGDPRAIGRTFHLVDPCPLPARKIYALVAEHANRRPPRTTLPMGLARALLRAPGLERVTRAPLALLDALDHLVLYNCRGTLELLAGTGLACPAPETYLETLVRYVRTVRADRRRVEDDAAADPLES